MVGRCFFTHLNAEDVDVPVQDVVPTISYHLGGTWARDAHLSWSPQGLDVSGACVTGG